MKSTKSLPRILSAILVMSMLIVVGCSGAKPAQPAPAAQPASEAPIELQFYAGFTGPDGDILEEMLKQWNTENPTMKVVLTRLQWTPLFEKLVTQAKAGTPPDLLALNAPDMGQWIDLGLLAPVDDLVKNAGLKKADFSAKAWENAQYKGKLYGFPLDQHMHGVYFNTEMFEKAGLDPKKPPRTGQELIDAAIKLTIDVNGKNPNQAGFDEKNVKQYGLGLPNNHHGFYMWYALMAQQGEGLLNKEMTKAQFDDAKGIKAWQFLSDLVFKHKVVPVGQKNPADDFRALRTAMMIDGPWQIPGMEKTPNLKWSTTRFPQVFEKDASWGSDHILTVPVQKEAKRQAAAAKLATWIAKNGDQWAKAGHIPSLKTATEKAKAMPGRGAFMDQLETEVQLPVTLKQSQLFSSAATSHIVVASQAILVANKPIADSLKAMRQGIDQVLTGP